MLWELVWIQRDPELPPAELLWEPQGHVIGS